MRCCSSRGSSSCYFDLFIGYQFMFLDSSLDLFLLVMQGIAALILAVVMNEDLRTAKKSLRWYWNFSMYSSSLGLLVEMLPGLSVPLEDHNLQVLEKMGLVRSENVQLS